MFYNRATEIGTGYSGIFPNFDLPSGKKRHTGPEQVIPPPLPAEDYAFV